MKHDLRVLRACGVAVCTVLLASACADRATASRATNDGYEGIGPHRRAVTTDSRGAQQAFEQGLAFLYAFNHDEAVRSFRQATEIDPKCAMAWWGIAYAKGPHINNPVVPPEREEAAYEAARTARWIAEDLPEGPERALIEAISVRYASPQPEDRAALDQEFAQAMAQVYRQYPDDGDVGALYAEALLDLHPWDLWTHDGEPQPWTPGAVGLLERLLDRHPDHPLALHLYIHAVEASNDPGRADSAADRLRDLMPGLGHMVHMPSHIDVRRGRWEQAIVANSKAIEADRAYREWTSTPPDFYRLYMAHNHHMKAYAAMMVGRRDMAMASIRELVADIPVDWLQANASWADGFIAMPYEVMMRFGLWEEILAEPMPADYLPFTRSLHHASRAVALAALDRPAEARVEQAAFVAQRRQLPEGATFGNNRAHDLLDVADRLVEGEISYREGRKEAGIAALYEAAAREDRLRYDEPPDWIQPVRHALGATLMQEGRHAEAEKVYREDLARLPENGWSLYGLSRSLQLQQRGAEAERVAARFTTVWADADVSLSSSCYCQPGV